jgi:hypothetical protein
MNGLGLIFWLFTAAYGGLNGGQWHYFWLRFSEGAGIFPLMTIIFSIIAISSYGT